MKIDPILKIYPTGYSCLTMALLQILRYIDNVNDKGMYMSL